MYCINGFFIFLLLSFDLVLELDPYDNWNWNPYDNWKWTLMTIGIETIITIIFGFGFVDISYTFGIALVM